ncbi:MAG: CvpA family protein [Candidatus Omnitrophica bacterium]|nr:CvpA family protein [Candidatus Omnitrophota bacterium]MDD5774693.1 CvpA family protein [Candidatus Omnitrophota bacterium]
MAHLASFLIHLNWVDILAFVIFLRILIVGLKNGAASEGFKLVAALVAAYVSLHYYRTAAEFLGNEYILDARTLEGSLFAVLACLGYAAIGFARLLFERFVNMTVVPALSRWGGCFLGILRAFLLTSLLFYFFMATDNPYLRKSVKTSISGTGLVFLAPSVYGFFWKTLMSKLTPNDTFNNAVFEIDRDHPKKKK